MNAIELTRKHYKRLRWYFQSPRGAASRADNLDLDLAAMGFIERSDVYEGVVCFRLTEKGTVELSAENKREIERRRPHHSLSGRVAQWLQTQGRITWENIEFVVDISSDSQVRRQATRPDVFSLMTTLNPTQIRPMVHEVKVSRADFLADIANPQKRGAYRAISEGIYYVTPAGMVSPDECPPECGLLVEIDDSFQIVKKHKRQPVELTAKQYMNLILKPGAAAPFI